MIIEDSYHNDNPTLYSIATQAVLIIDQAKPRIDSDFHGDLEKNAMEVLIKAKELYELATDSPRAFMAIREKHLADPKKFLEETASNKDSLDPLTLAYRELFEFGREKKIFYREEYGVPFSCAISDIAFYSSKGIRESIEQQLRPTKKSLQWNLEQEQQPDKWQQLVKKSQNSSNRHCSSSVTAPNSSSDEDEKKSSQYR